MCLLLSYNSLYGNVMIKWRVDVRLYKKILTVYTIHTYSLLCITWVTVYIYAYYIQYFYVCVTDTTQTNNLRLQYAHKKT